MATYYGNNSNNSWNGTKGDDIAWGQGGNDTLFGDDGNDTLYGGAGNDQLTGGRGDDVIYGGGGTDALNGWGGDDYLEALNATGLTGLYGQQGNDTLVGSVPGGGQIHMGGREGDDTLVFDLTNSSGHQGHHAYGGTGADSFVFRNIDDTASPILGRIDDFDNSQDSIWIENDAGVRVRVNLANVRNNTVVNGVDVDVVSYNGQQWLRLDNKALYALEGARDGGTERHFTALPASIAALPAVVYVDQVNFVPWAQYSARAASLDTSADTSLTVIAGTSGDDLIEEYRVNSGNEESAQVGYSNSSIDAGAGDDVINAGKGMDTVRGGEGDDLIAGGMDQDRLYGDAGNDRVWGGSENDTLYGGSGNDSLWGGTGNDYLRGDDGNDRMYGGEGDDRLYGRNDNDSLYGENGNDRLYGENGNDLLYGQNGNDQLYGGSGNDRIYGQNHADSLYGEAGDDTLDGGNGNDLLRGGAGRDVATGGSGADVFEFVTGDLLAWGQLSGTTEQKHAQLDVISDFTIGQDKIRFLGHAEVDSRDDLHVFKTTLDDNVYFTVRVRATNERVLVDVEDTVEWSEFFGTAAFAQHFEIV